MRVLLIWHGATGGLYPERLQALGADPRIELHVVVPARWQGDGVLRTSQSQQFAHYRLSAVPAYAPYHGSIFFFHRQLRQVISAWAPDIIHLTEEPWSLVTRQCLGYQRRFAPQAGVVVESWQNIRKNFPSPFNQIEQHTLRQADHLVAGSEEIREVLRSKGAGSNISVVPLATSPERFFRQENPALKEELAPGLPLIGYIGRIVTQKGLHHLLYALPQVNTPCRLLLLGDGPQRQELIALSQQLGITERVRFITQVPYDQVPMYISQLDALVLPSLTTPTWKEQFGRVLIEAMACQVPVIGSDSGEIPVVIGNAGLVYPEGDSAMLAAAIDALLSDPAKRSALAQAGYERVHAHYTWARITEQTIQVYEQACAHKRRKDACHA
jgi:glycosyltransferase involved in cell wall biosynthesis